MEAVLPVSVFLLVGTGVYLLLQRGLVRVVLGLGVLSHGVHLLILSAGRIGSAAPLAGTAATPEQMSDPLPQALVLTSIVISMAMTLYLLATLVAVARRGPADRLEPPPERDEPDRGEPVLAQLEGREGAS